MQHLTAHLPTLHPPKPAAGPQSERGELLGRFLGRLNADRKPPRKPLTARLVAVKLAHVPTGDLWAFYRQCEAARSFGAYFWWAIREQAGPVGRQTEENRVSPEQALQMRQVPQRRQRTN